MKLHLPTMLLLLASACSSSCTRAKSATPAAALPFDRLTVDTASAVLVGAGDVTHCNALEPAKATAALLARIDGTVFVLGDGSNGRGRPEEYAECFGTTWGRFRDRLRPAPGNHDYVTENAAGYFGYYGEPAGEPGKGFYSYQAGGWHVVVLNSNCEAVGGCGPGSEQERWLREDLAAHPAKCTVAYWHHPRFSSGLHGGDERVDGFWRALHEAGAELVLNGHDHHYERFVPLAPDGKPDPKRGVRQLISGTGGARLRNLSQPIAGSETHVQGVHGVTRLVLREGSYEWQFISVEGKVLDSGSGRCH